MSFFNNIYNKKESFYLRIKWSIIIILSLLFLTGIAYFFYFIFSPADSNQMKEIKDSWVFYTKDDPDFKFDSKYTRTIPTVDKDETFIMETTLEKPLDEANLLIKGNHQWITVYLGEKILYQTERLSGRKQSRTLIGCDRFTSKLYRKKIDPYSLISLSELCWTATESLSRNNWTID